MLDEEVCHEEAVLGGVDRGGVGARIGWVARAWRPGYVAWMPFKHNATRRYRILKARYRVTNWPAYEAGLKRRGDMTFWLDEAALSGWQAPRRTTPCGQPRYSDLAIELVLTLRLVLHLALRQAEAFTGTMLRLLGLELTVPDHTTLSRRARSFAGRQPRAGRHDGPIHLVLDSTGLQVFGQGEWNAAKHGRTRRQWRKLHFAVDIATGEVVAHVLTGGHADDAAQAPDLLRQVEGRIASVTADGAYDGEPVYQAATARQHDPPPDVIIPPRTSAVPSTSNVETQNQRDRHVALMAERDAWVGSGRPATAGATTSRP